MTTRFKRSTEDKLEDFDFSTILPTGVNLSSLVVTQTNQGFIAASSALTIVDQTVSAQLGQAKIGGGTDGESYLLHATGVDDGGETHVIDDSILFVSDTQAVADLTENLDSFNTLAELRTFFANRHDTTWEHSGPVKQIAAAREAYLYMLGEYRWKGQIVSTAQTGPFPRAFLVDEDGRTLDSTTTPTQVKRAHALLSKEALSGPLLPTSASTTGALKKAKSGDDEVEYFEGSSQTGQKTFEYVDGILAGITKPANKLERTA